MELTGLICDADICRLCGEENSQGCELFSNDENEEDLSDLVNRYLPIKIENDRKYPTKICPGCTIQLEATKSFMDLVIEGQLKLRDLYKTQNEKVNRLEKQRLQLEEALQSVNPTSTVDTYTIESDETGEKFLIQIFSQGPLFPPDHDLSLKAEGLTKPRRKRGRPPKSSQVPAEETSPPSEPIREEPIEEPEVADDGKRKRRKPSRYQGSLAGKELEKVFKQQGVIDEESPSDEDEARTDREGKVERVIGRIETENGEVLGQPILVNKPHKPKHKKNLTKKKRRFQCEICHKEFLHHGRYEVHKRLHDVWFRCTAENCDFESDKKQLLDKHQKETQHKGHKMTEKVDKYGVIQLPGDAENVAELPTAKKTEEELDTSDKKTYFCDQCDKQYTCKQNYEVHLKAVHTGERPYACTVCDKRFSYSNTLKIHQLKHARAPSAAISEQDENNGQYRCTSCPKVFRHPSSLQYHRETEHANGRRFVCNKCDKPFKHRQLLQRHQLVHTNERPYKCDQCQNTFKTRPALYLHTRTVHIGTKSYWCTQCDKAFAHKTALTLHQRWHEGVRPHKCEFCPKAFTQKGNLVEHRRIHTGEKPFQCDDCGKAFTTSSQLKLHNKRHQDERPYKCPQCDKKFIHKVNMRSHQRRHAEDKPHKCSHCPKTFPDAWSLKKHERMHSGEKPYKCEVCHKQFSDSSNLTKHRKIHSKSKSAKIVEDLGEEEDKQNMLLLTIGKDMGDAIVSYIDQETTNAQQSLLESEMAEEIPEGTVQLQQLVDQDGNPISFTTQDGQQVKVVTSTEDGQENIQGLLPDGTLVPISLTTLPDKTNSLSQQQIEQLDESVGVAGAAVESPPAAVVSSLDKLDETALELDDGSGELLPNNIQFLDDVVDDKVNNIQFITEDNQNMCLVTTYNIDDAINQQYLGLQ